MAPIINRLETGRLALRAASKVSSQFTPSRRMTIVTFRLRTRSGAIFCTKNSDSYVRVHSDQRGIPLPKFAPLP
jgi:hypothetical protein